MTVLLKRTTSTHCLDLAAVGTSCSHMLLPSLSLQYIKCVPSHLTYICSEYIAKHIWHNGCTKMPVFNSFLFSRNDSSNVESINRCETTRNNYSLIGMHMSMEGGMEVVEGVGGNCREAWEGKEIPGGFMEVSL